MKMFLGAIALLVAVPAYAQTAPVADPHSGHNMPADHHQDSMNHDCKACCEKMKKADGTMDCMDDKKPATAANPATPDHGAHAGHGQ